MPTSTSCGRGWGWDPRLPLRCVWIFGDRVGGRLRSFRERRPVTEMVGEALVPTIILATLAIALAVGLSLPIALASALRPYTPLDHGVTVFSLLGISVPGVWFGLA